MTDYRLRNHDLLYAPRGKRPLDRRVIIIFGLIAAVVLFVVAGHLADRFNATTPGSTSLRQAAPIAPVTVATPGATRPGS